MRTVISEYDTAARTSGRSPLEAAPRRLPAQWQSARSRSAGVTRTRRADRGPAVVRPISGLVRYDEPRAAVSRPRGPHPMVRVERARVGFATLAAAALLTALVVCGLFAVAQLRTAAPAAGRTEVVQVQPGESLSDIATRVAPGVPAAETVRKIVELNGLPVSDVAPGRTLIVPAPGR